jgi:chaperonin cofactor prefoldin
LNNWQLYLAAGLPTITTLVGILLAYRRADELGGRMDRLDSRMDRLDSRMDRLETQMNSRFDQIQHDLIQFYPTSAAMKPTSTT